MNFSTNGFSSKEIFAALKSSKRKVSYEYTLHNSSGHMVGTVCVKNAVITFDSRQSVMRTFRGSLRSSDVMNINKLDYGIIPWFCFEYKGLTLKFPLGKFIIKPSENCSDSIKMVEVLGYDMSKKAVDDKSESFICIRAGTIYTSFISQMLGDMYEISDVEASDKTCSIDIEWQIGTEKIQIINEMLQSINYNPLWVNEYGIPQVSEYKDPQNKSCEIIYSDDIDSVITDGISHESNNFDIPNKVIRYVENMDRDIMTAVYINDNDKSPYSVTNRGRIITDCKSVSDINNQSDLDKLAITDALKLTMAADRIKFNTINMPCHGYLDTYILDIKTYGISGKVVETAWEMDLESGIMRHECEKVVSI